jgi:hypothetical protein
MVKRTAQDHNVKDTDFILPCNEYLRSGNEEPQMSYAVFH